VFWLKLNATPPRYTAEQLAEIPLLAHRTSSEARLLRLTQFEWTGNHFREAPQAAQRWWARLRRWVTRSATKLRSGRILFWGFPSALAKLQRGMPYYANGFNLAEALKIVDTEARGQSPDAASD
jgi:hypothetical protein